jgi:hypothetical protein
MEYKLEDHFMSHNHPTTISKSRRKRAEGRWILLKGI